MAINVYNADSTLESLHKKLSADVRNKRWYSNCAGEIFVDNGTREHLRIGHFQGDAAIAEFVVAAHEAIRTSRAKQQKE